MDILSSLYSILWMATGPKQYAHVLQTCTEIGTLLLPIWISVLVGLIVGWSWRPRWVGLFFMALRTRPRVAWAFPPGFGARRLWLAVTAVAAVPALKNLFLSILNWILRKVWSLWRRNAFRFRRTFRWHDPGSPLLLLDCDMVQDSQEQFAGIRDAEEVKGVVGIKDLEELWLKIDERDGGPPWSLLMEKETAGMKYTAWRRDPVESPTEYRSHTVIADCSAELMRDFFWDDEFRVASQWDDMIRQCQVVEECQHSGQQIVRWIRKFPFFCKDREYVIGRRIWSLDNVFYCVTKGVAHTSVPPKDEPRRVSVFFSSWRIRAGPNGSCEVYLFHSEDMGIQRHLAKLGIQRGMWPAVKNMETGVRKYQHFRSGEPAKMSRSASLATIHTPISPSGPTLTRIWNSLSDFRVTAESQEEEDAARLDATQSTTDHDSQDLDRANREEIVAKEPGQNGLCVGLCAVAGAIAVACGVRRSAVFKIMLLAGAAQQAVNNKTRSRSRRK